MEKHLNLQYLSIILAKIEVKTWNWKFVEVEENKEFQYSALTDSWNLFHILYLAILWSQKIT